MTELEVWFEGRNGSRSVLIPDDLVTTGWFDDIQVWLENNIEDGFLIDEWYIVGKDSNE